MVRQAASRTRNAIIRRKKKDIQRVYAMETAANPNHRTELDKGRPPLGSGLMGRVRDFTTFQGLTTLLLGSKFTPSLLIRGNHGHTRNIQVF
jgi:hypothetical protein